MAGVTSSDAPTANRLRPNRFLIPVISFSFFLWLCAPLFFFWRGLLHREFLDHLRLRIEAKAGCVGQGQPILVHWRHAGEDRLAGLHRRGLEFERGSGGAASLHVHIVPEITAAI